MNHATEIVLSSARFDELVANAPVEVVADVENKGEWPGVEGSALLGVSFSFRPAVISQNNERPLVVFYVPFWEWDTGSQTLRPVGECALFSRVKNFLSGRAIIGHQVEHDRVWLEETFGVKLKVKADTRKMWHLKNPDLLHGHGLKVAQVEVLGWEERGDGELKKAVEERGGKLSNGDHYLAPLDVLGHYACLDTLSTLLLFEKLSPFFDELDYWSFLDWRLNYHRILTEATLDGMPVDEEILFEARAELVVKKEAAEKSIREVCAREIAIIEEKWHQDKLAGYVVNHAREKYLANPEKRRKFNPNSSDQRNILFHEVIGLPVEERTETGQPKSDRDTIAHLNHPAAKPFVDLSEVDAVLKLANSYVESLKPLPGGGYRIHFPYDTSAVVSDRLGGFKPYALNMPFSEEKLMSAFRVPEGFIGIHADLRAIEPCLIAAYSEDPTLLKVHRDGLGDVYLDLALKLFPENCELAAEYNPLVPLDDIVKKKFKRERDISKIIHLAVGYTGTWWTVWRNLRKHGFDIDQQEAKRLVNRYWSAFWVVKEFETRLKRMHERQGYLRNIMGRVINVPEKFKKDTMNRFIQSGGHDCLTFWVSEISRLRNEQPGIQMKPVLPDIHDSTSWIVREEHYEAANRIFEAGLRELNARLALPVQIRAEVKSFRTLAGLKGDER